MQGTQRGCDAPARHLAICFDAGVRAGMNISSFARHVACAAN